MRVYTVIRCHRLEEYPAAIQRAEALGYDGVSLLEITIPPTLSAVAAALNSTRLSILTAVMVAFPAGPWPPLTTLGLSSPSRADDSS